MSSSPARSPRAPWALVSYARAKGWDLGEVTVDIDYDTLDAQAHRDNDPARRRTGTVAARAAPQVAAACPLRRSIESGFTFAERLELVPKAA